MRDRDRTILHYLSQAKTCIKSIHNKQQHSLKVQSDVEKRHLYGSTEDLNNTQQIQNGVTSDKYGTLASNISRPFISSGALCTSPTMATPVTLSTSETGYGDMINSFFGDDFVGEIATLSKVSDFSFELNDQSFSNKERMKTRQEVKVESNEKRHSAISEIQMLRKQLQQETRRELENFDKAFDAPKLLEIDEDKTSYRHSILNRMDEILNHKTDLQKESSHVRQYSEPIMTSSVSEFAISTTNNQNKPNSKLMESQSFKYPSKQNTGITRSDSAGIPKGAGVKMRSGSTTHYDTTVIGKRKSRPSSRNSTLERQRNNPAHYSIDSLSGSDTNISSDHDSPDHKVGIKHRVVSPLQPSMLQHSSLDSDSPEIHPELSPLSPLLNNNIDSFMMTSHVFEEYTRNGNGMEKVLNSGSKSTPISRKNGVTTAKDRWQ